MRARLTAQEQGRLRDVQGFMQAMESALHVEGTLEDVAREAERAAGELALLATDIRLRRSQEAA